jgi:putative ABC transport system permease protein
MYGPSSVLHDLRYAIRRLRNSPGFSAVAIATVALAIGANTAMFSFVNGLLLRPLPYPESDRIVRVLERLPTGGLNGISALNYLDWTNRNAVFEYMAAEVGWRATLTGAGEPVSIRGARVSAQYFDIFGAKPALGRTFLRGEDQAGNDRVVLLSHVLWERRFGSDPVMLGRDILLNGEAYTVIGVLQKGPFDRAAAQIWTPLAFQPSNMTRDFRWLGASAKLKPGVTLQKAQAQMDVIGQRIANAYPDSNKGWSVAVDRLADVLIGPGLHTAVTVLFAATLFVLLIGCANLANLALARNLSRESEMAVRAALGASRWRLVRQLLIENVVISVCGGIVGIGVGYAMLKWIQSLIPPSALPPAVDIGMDTSVLLFTLTVAVVTGLLFGMAPAAAQTTNPSLVSTLKEGGHGTTAGCSGRRMRGGLVVAEIVLAFVLLVASGLLMRSFFKLLDIDPGFDATNVLTAGLPISQEHYPDPNELNAYLASISAAVEAVPGVRETAMTSALPLQGWGYGVPYSIAGREIVNRANRRPAFFKIVSPSYVHALGIKLLAGRLLSDNDMAGAPPVALINETLAKREFPDEKPIGRRILVREIVPGKSEFGREIAWEIVGVIAGERINGLGDAISAGMYVSNQQSPTYAINLIVRAGMPAQSLQRALRSAVDRVNKDQALSDVRTLEQIVDQSMLGNRVANTLLTAFAAMALLLAAMGIYGVISNTAAQRTHEMGIRAALGASAGSLRTLIFQRGMRLTLIGLLIGLTATFPATDVLSSMLYGVGTYDPLTIAVVAVVLSGVAGLACFLPAWRITKVDPMEALRRQ